MIKHTSSQTVWDRVNSLIPDSMYMVFKNDPFIGSFFVDVDVNKSIDRSKATLSFHWLLSNTDVTIS